MSGLVEGKVIMHAVPLASSWNLDPAVLITSIALLAGYFRGSSLEIGDEYLLASIALVVIGGTSVSGGKANVAGLWGAGLFLVLLLTMLNTFGVSAGVRLVVTGLVIIAVIIAAGGQKAGSLH